MRAELSRYVMIGGFLGAGKTTAIARIARILADRGLRVGLICNDQSKGLVDTALLRSKGFPVEEITGGCFCCRFGSLLEASEKLERAAAPDVFLAEPVGSCTDLVATVSYPLRRIYGDRFRVAPLSVMVDPLRAARIFGLERGPVFSEKVVYVYRKQLEEARVIVVNKCDAQPAALVDHLVAALGESFPHARVLRCSAKDGAGLGAWIDLVFADDERAATPDLELDYEVYADGEALLGWCNATLRVEAAGADGLFAPTDLVVGLARDIRQRVVARGGAIAHGKITLDPLDGHGLAVVSVVADEGEPDLREAVFERAPRGELVVNLRAEADPALLEAAIRGAVAARTDVRAAFEHLERFRPPRPVPTHRLTAAETRP